MQHKPYTSFTFFKIYVAVASLVCFALLALWYFGFTEFLVPGFSLLIFFTALLSFRVLQLIYQMQLERQEDVNQVDALLWNYAQFVPGVKIPAMRKFAGSPDFLSLIIEQMQQGKPKVIVEAGSGVSSIVVSEYLLHNKSTAQHFALDHERRYADETRKKIRNTNSHILYAPLKSYQIKGKSWQWYDLNPLPAIPPIDLLIIDGPPEKLQPQARYPAMPLLLERLSPNATIIMDDANRKDDLEVAKQWMAEFQLSGNFERTEKGTYILKR